MRLYKRGATWHYDAAVDGIRLRGSSGVGNKAKALQIAEDAIVAARLGIATKASAATKASTKNAGPLTLGQAAEAWWEAHARHLKSELDIARRLSILMRHIPPQTELRQIGSRVISQALQARLASKAYATHPHKKRSTTSRLVSSATANRDIIDATLRPIFKFAATQLEEPLRPIPWEKLRVGEPPGRTRRLTPIEVDEIRGKLDVWMVPILDFFVRYGLRLSEGFFAPDQFDPTTGVIVIPAAKRKRPQTLEIPLIEDDIPAMCTRVSIAKAANSPVVWMRPRHNGPVPIRPRSFGNAMYHAIRAAGITDVRSVHDLRHTALSNLVAATGDIMMAKKLAGHASIVSTQRYVHADLEALRTKLRDTYHGTPAAHTENSKINLL